MTTRHTMAAGLVAGVLALLAGACGTARRSEPILGARAAPDATFAAGRSAFLRHCHECHPGGEAGLGPAINNKPLPGWLIEFQARHGLGAMPSFDAAKISDAELEEIARYLVELRRAR